MHSAEDSQELKAVFNTRNTDLRREHCNRYKVHWPIGPLPSAKI